MSTSPARVLRAIAYAIGCSYDGIEAVINAELGGEPIEPCDDVEERLLRIRRKLMTPEAEDVIGQARRTFAKDVTS